MKQRRFRWGWGHFPYTPQHDPHMTAERAVRLFRAWRSSKTQGKRDFHVTRIAPHYYVIRYNPTFEESVFTWEQA